MSHFHAGYIADIVTQLITTERLTKSAANDPTCLQIQGLLEHVSSFDVSFPFDALPDYNALPSVIATINNIICRGLPTKAPVIVEEALESALAWSEKDGNPYEENYKRTDACTLDFTTIFELLHIVEPELNIERDVYAGPLGSSAEWNFLDNTLKPYPFAKQILQPQRLFSTISAGMVGGRSVDFSYSCPYLLWNPQTKAYENHNRIFEVDGPHHKLESYKIYDKYRDEAAAETGFQTLRFPVGEKQKDSPEIDKLFEKPLYQLYAKNYQRSIAQFSREYILLFTPIAVARVQKTILECLLRQPDLLKKETVKIAVVERDVPCAALAIDWLNEAFHHLSVLIEESGSRLPFLELDLYADKRFQNFPALHRQHESLTEQQFIDTKSGYDFIIDHSIFCRSGIYRETNFLSEKAVIVRSSHYADKTYGQARRVYCAALLPYKAIVKKQEDGSYVDILELKESIEFFLKNIFRKASLREGQPAIISRALRQLPVIGLLPTGGGKSLTFQLTAFLQPGICLVVDPIKSLMEDQVRVLNEAWIDNCAYINSTLKREEKTKRLIDFRWGETQFLFVSPERFVMEEFRRIVHTIDAYWGLAISYCVIDEVHCVSEWGHDFRTTYLSLGKNAQKYCKARSGIVSLMGLTATASFDVLADIERELQIEHEDLANAIVMIENTIRPELFFRVCKVTTDKFDALQKEIADLGKNLQALNDEAVLETSFKHHLENFNGEEKSYDWIIESGKNKVDLSLKPVEDFPAVIFCPVKSNQRKDYGVQEIYESLPSGSKGFFYGSIESDVLEDRVQENFKLFTANKLSHMVCTKAFGMGIDKKDIRVAFHVVYSSSLESFVQEAGRAGRDKKIAESIILASDRIFYKVPESFLSRYCDALPALKNRWTRKTLRFELFKELYNSRDKIESAIQRLNFRYPPPPQQLAELKEALLKAVVEHSEEREVHNFFYNNAFKGHDTEKSQIYNLFHEKEFVIDSRLKELNGEYNELHETAFEFKLWKKSGLRLYVSTIEGDEMGFIRLIEAQNITRPTTCNEECLINILSFIIEKNDGDSNIMSFVSQECTSDIEGQGTLIEEFEKAQTETFTFRIAADKIYEDRVGDIYLQLPIATLTSANELDTIISRLLVETHDFESFYGKLKNEVRWFYLSQFDETEYKPELKISYDEADDQIKSLTESIYKIQIEKALKNSKNNFFDFLLRLEEDISGLAISLIPERNKRQLRFIYNRDRHNRSNDTGRLIYRMFCMGFLEDYMIDYNKDNMYICNLRKHDAIEAYTDVIQQYFLRYLSETSTDKRMEQLHRVLKPDAPLIENIMQCLYFLSSFSQETIAGKRKTATDEIESLVKRSFQITDRFLQNQAIKEEIYYYFNAKYARLDYQIKGNSYSLLTDTDKGKNSKWEWIEKYINVFSEDDGPEKNNYKHMIGSCRKILRSMLPEDLENEWTLRLLKAYAMYSVNNESYIFEANEDLERGFVIFYGSLGGKRRYFDFKEKFDKYFDKLRLNLIDANNAFLHLKLVKQKIMFEIHTDYVNRVIQKHQNFKTENYA